MGMEKRLNAPINIGRRTISYVAIDPAGGASLFAGYELFDKSLWLSIPFFVFSAWHIPRMLNIRKKLDKKVKENNGLKEEIIKEFNKPSWCSHRVTIAYAIEQGEYDEFKELLNEYPYKHYAKRLKYQINKKIKQGVNYFFSSLKNSV